MHTALYMVLALLTALMAPSDDLTDASPQGPTATARYSDPLGDDDDLPQLSIDDVSIDEGGSSATFTVTRVGKSKKKVEVDIATSDLEATAGTDYTHQVTTLVFPTKPQVATKTFTVPILDDDIDEASETFAVTLSNPYGATLQRNIGVGTIVDDDTAGIIVDSDDGIFVVEGEGFDTLGIALQSQPIAEVVVTVAAPSDQLTVDPTSVAFDAANWAQPQQVHFTAVSDGIDEVDPHQVPISFSVVSADAQYAAATPPPILASVGDMDSLLVTIYGPSAGATNMPAAFNAVVNAGGTGTITYGWAAFLQGNAVATGDQANFLLTPDQPGAYVVRATVGDEQGQNPAQFVEFIVIADVTDSTFATDIVWLAEQGITRGCSPDGTEFCPDQNVTRAQMAAFLSRFLNLTDGGGNPFVDDDGSIFENDIAKLAAAGITSGCNPPDNDMFCPNAEISRAQMAVLLVRALNLSDDGGGNTFVDDDGSIFEADIAKLAAAGITRGCDAEGTRFCPDQAVTRGEMAAFLHRADDLTS